METTWVLAFLSLQPGSFLSPHSLAVCPRVIDLVNDSFINLTYVSFLPHSCHQSLPFFTPPLQDARCKISPPGLSPRPCSRLFSTLPPSKSSYWSIQFLGLKILRPSGLLNQVFTIPHRVALRTTCVTQNVTLSFTLPNILKIT